MLGLPGRIEQIHLHPIDRSRSISNWVSNGSCSVSISRNMKARLFLSLLAAVAISLECHAKLDVLVVTGGHGFQHDAFFDVFKANSEITFTEAKHNKDADAYERDDLLKHDGIVLYDMPKVITDAQKAMF